MYKAKLRSLKSNVGSFHQPNAFDRPEILKEIPLTIRDAMEATHQMNIRYLWVDALCIAPDNETGEKMGHIKLTDLVYQAACLVVVAQSGMDANVGLPGVRS